MSSQAELLKQQALERSAARKMAAGPSVPQVPNPRPAAPLPQLADDGETVWGALLGTLIGLALAVGGLAIGVGVVGLGGETQSYWYLSRAAGFVAYLLLWGSVVWGLLLSSKIGKGALRPAALLDAHQFLSGVGLGFAFFHGLILMGDRYLSFPLAAVLLPFAGEYEPVLVAVGQIALWLSALLIATFYVRQKIGQKRWRLIHYSGFLAFWLALAHAVFLGTESANLWVQLLYLLSGGAVIFLTVYRILTARGQRVAIPT